MADSKKKIEIEVIGSDKASAPLRSAQTAVSRLAQTLENAKKSARSFNSLFELGFGVGVGGKFFEKMHDGLARAAKGFWEAQMAGKSFAESIDEAGRAFVGLETNLQKARKATEEFAKSRRQILVLEGKAGAQYGKAIGAPGTSSRFPYLADPGAADETLATLREAVKLAKEAARPAQDMLTKAVSQEALLRGYRSSPLTSGGVNLRQSLPEFTGLRVVDESSDVIRHRYRGVLGQLDLAETQLREYTQQLEKTNAEARKVDNLYKQASTWMADRVANIRGGVRGAGYGLDERFGAVAGVFGRGLSSIPSAIAGGAKARGDFLRSLPEGVRDEALRKLERFRSSLTPAQYTRERKEILDKYQRDIQGDKPGKYTAPSFTATESRYLSRGEGQLTPQILTLKEANRQRSEVIRTNKQIIRKLQNIEKKMMPLAAANIA